MKSILLTDGDDLEIHIEILLSEVARREKSAAETYPFSWTDIGVSRLRTVDQTPYEFLLWLAVSPIYRQENRYPEIDELFDNLVKQALIMHLGHSAVGVRFGSPASGTRPIVFRDAVKWLSGLLQLQAGVAVPRPQVKDGGVDVVVWNPFATDVRAS